MFMFFGINAILSIWPIGKINLASGEKNNHYKIDLSVISVC